MNNDASNSLGSSNETKRTTESEELSYVDTKLEKSIQKDSINISKPLLIENYAEILIQKLLTQKLRHLKSNDANLPYYFHGSI